MGVFLCEVAFREKKADGHKPRYVRLRATSKEVKGSSLPSLLGVPFPDCNASSSNKEAMAGFNAVCSQLDRVRSGEVEELTMQDPVVMYHTYLAAVIKYSPEGVLERAEKLSRPLDKRFRLRYNLDVEPIFVDKYLSVDKKTRWYMGNGATACGGTCSRSTDSPPPAVQAYKGPYRYYHYQLPVRLLLLHALRVDRHGLFSILSRQLKKHSEIVFSPRLELGLEMGLCDDCGSLQIVDGFTLMYGDHICEECMTKEILDGYDAEFEDEDTQQECIQEALDTCDTCGGSPWWRLANIKPAALEGRSCR